MPSVMPVSSGPSQVAPLSWLRNKRFMQMPGSRYSSKVSLSSKSTTSNKVPSRQAAMREQLSRPSPWAVSSSVRSTTTWRGPQVSPRSKLRRTIMREKGRELCPMLSR